ncbi:MAG: GAF domain-containing protein, partial [Chitinophagales bacterium]
MVNKTLLITQKETISQEDIYLPLSVLKSQFSKNAKDLPYQASFSLSALLKKWQKKSSHDQSSIAIATTALIEEIELGLKETGNSQQNLNDSIVIEEAIKLLFPSLFFENQIGFISIPFSKNFVFMSPAFQNHLDSDEWEIKMTSKNIGHASEKFTLEVAGFVLNKFYGQDLDMCPSEIMTLRHRDTKLERHYKINTIFDYVEGEAIQPLNPLSQAQIQELLNNTENIDLYLNYIPPENFTFNGFFIGYLTDVTGVEVLSNMKAKMVEEEGYVDFESEQKKMNYLQLQVRSLLNLPSLEVGCLQMIFGGWKERTNWSLFKDYKEEESLELFTHDNPTYAKVLQNKEALIIGDLVELENKTLLENRLLQKGIRSLLLAPLFNNEGKISGVFELGLQAPYRFSEITLKGLKEIIALFSLGLERSQRDIQKQMVSVLQEQFTAMHPSVAWKFTNAAFNYMFKRQKEGSKASIEPIVFQDVYPLYGQADIVGSSKLRNDAIRADLIDNLEKVEKVLSNFRKKLSFHLLDM